MNAGQEEEKDGLLAHMTQDIEEWAQAHIGSLEPPHCQSPSGLSVLYGVFWVGTTVPWLTWSEPLHAVASHQALWQCLTHTELSIMGGQ